MQKLLIIALLMLAGSSVRAQSNFIKVYTDQSVYIAGEKIWLSGMKFGKNLDQEKPVHMYLADRNGNVVERVQFLQADGKISCSMQLKGDLVTDNYLVVVKSTGCPPVFIPVAIINPVMPPKPVEPTELSAATAKSRELPVKPEKEFYSKRELVNLTLDSLRSNELQVSVLRRDALSAYIDSLHNSWQVPELDIQETKQAGDGQQLKIIVQNMTTNAPAAGVRVFAAVLGDQANIATAVSDEKGIAELYMPFVYGNVSLVLTAAGQAGQSYKLVYDEAPVTIKGNINLPGLQLDERFRVSITERLLNTEVYNKYRPESKIRYLAAGLDTTDFYGKPDKRYLFDDYTRIPNMEEILFEYVLEVRARKSGDKPVLLVLNSPFKTFFELPALVLIDGVPVSDINQLLSLDPLQLKSVDIVAKKFLLDDLQIPGVVHYKSYKADLGGYKLSAQDIVYPIQGNAIPVEPQFPSYEKTGEASNMPDFRNLLYWKSFSKTNFRNRFYTPDSEGEYAIRVRGLDKDGNEYLGETVITVK